MSFIFITYEYIREERAWAAYDMSFSFPSMIEWERQEEYLYDIYAIWYIMR